MKFRIEPINKNCLLQETLYVNTETKETTRERIAWRWGWLEVELNADTLEEWDEMGFTLEDYALNEDNDIDSSDFESILDLELSDGSTYEEADWDEDELEKLENENKLDYKTLYSFEGPTKITVLKDVVKPKSTEKDEGKS